MGMSCNDFLFSRKHLMMSKNRGAAYATGAFIVYNYKRGEIKEKELQGDYDKDGDNPNNEKRR